MCFSENWSLGLGIAGGLITSYRTYFEYPIISILIPIFYTIMEITQYYQYTVIDKCDNVFNQNLTKFTWFLQWIQPLLWNLTYFYITKSNKEVFKFAAVLSFIVFIAAMLRVFNTSNRKSFSHEAQVNGRNCAVSGEKHIKWENNAQTYYGLEPNWGVFILLWFIPILWIRPIHLAKNIFSWQILGIVITSMLLYKRSGYEFMDQFASTWCFISIPGVILGEFVSK